MTVTFDGQILGSVVREFDEKRLNMKPKRLRVKPRYTRKSLVSLKLTVNCARLSSTSLNPSSIK